MSKFKTTPVENLMIDLFGKDFRNKIDGDKLNSYQKGEMLFEAFIKSAFVSGKNDWVDYFYPGQNDDKAECEKKYEEDNYFESLFGEKL